MNPVNSSIRSAPVLDLIGNTPMLRLEVDGVCLLAKAEFVNPSGSIKDRLARCLVLDALERGELRPDSIITECTSGNTGIALAMTGAALGLAVRIIMSSSASVERRRILQRLGAEVVLFETEGSYQEGIDLTRRMAAEDSRVWLPRQFENELNAVDHTESTAQEIIRQAGGEVHAFVSGYGTGGTITGVGRGLKARWPGCQVVAMEPGSGFQPGECPCAHRIEGVAHCYVPPLVLAAPIDRRITVTGSDALGMTRRLHREYGLLVGTSSGANVCAALEVAREAGPGARVVTILCDRAERYFSTALFCD